MPEPTKTPLPTGTLIRILYPDAEISPDNVAAITSSRDGGDGTTLYDAMVLSGTSTADGTSMVGRTLTSMRLEAGGYSDEPDFEVLDAD